MSDADVSVLLVDDDETFRKVMASELERLGMPTIVCADGAAALSAVQRRQADVALVDLRLPGRDGISIMEALQLEDPALPVILLTGHGSIEKAVEAMRRGAFDFLSKPCPLEELERVLRKAISYRTLATENQRLRRLLGGSTSLLGVSPSMVDLRERIARVAASASNVLIRGESGSGKELVARAVHDGGDRADATFVPVNCAGVPESLFESEFFGHEKGAFTGADRRKIGLFEAADGGTLFLDEVGELPHGLQAKLLRVLQSGEIRRVAGAAAFKVDVRVIAATNRDLVDEIHAGGFREDLYYRLAILELHVPPLRSRHEDLLPLLHEFLARRGLPDLRLEPRAEERLREHHWPGNVRELESLAERLVVMHTSNPATRADVEGCLIPGLPQRDEPVLPLAVLEKAHILNALRRFAGDKKAAASALGISLRTLYNRLKDYGEG